MMDPQQQSSLLHQQQMAIARQQQLAVQQGQEPSLMHAGSTRSPHMQDPGMHPHLLQQHAALAQAQAQQAAAAQAAYSQTLKTAAGGLLLGHSHATPLPSQDLPPPAPYYHQLPEALSHSTLLNAAMDPSGSLSHIDVSLLGASPPSGFPAPTPSPLTQQSPGVQPVVTTGRATLKAEESTGDGQHGMFVRVCTDSTGAPECKVRHPEVGDVIGDGSLSHEDVIQHFKQYAIRVGFSMTRNFDNLDASGRHRRVRIACKQGGLPRKTIKHENPALQRERTSQKVGCPFEVTIWRTKQRPGGVQSDTEQWVVTNVKGINHGPCALLDGCYHPLSKRHDGINKDVQEEIKARLKTKQNRAGSTAAPPSPAPTSPAASPQPASPLPPAHLELAGKTSFARVIFSKIPSLPADQGTKLALLLLEIASAGKRISWSLSSGAAFRDPAPMGSEPSNAVAAANDEFQQGLDGIAGVQFLSSSSNVSELSMSDTDMLAVTVDALSGSNSLNAAMPCGSIFGVFSSSSGADGSPSISQLVAGYILYAAATILVITFGDGVYSFTLDGRSGEFVLSNSQVRIPPRGQCYSVNEAGYGQWPSGMQSYIQDIVQGNGQTKKPYSSRHSTSVVADFHRMLVQGGVFLNPGHHLRLMHVSMPLSLITEQAGGTATDGNMRLLDHKSNRLDSCVPSYLGSTDDMAELSTYLQQPLHSLPAGSTGL